MNQDKSADDGKKLAVIGDPRLDQKKGGDVVETQERMPRRRVPLEYREYVEIAEERAEEPAFSLLHYLNVLLKKRWMIIGGTLLFCLAAFIYTKFQTPVYQAATNFTPARAQNMSSRLDASFGLGRSALDAYSENVYLVEYYTKILSGAEFLERVAVKPFQIAGSNKPITLMEYYKENGATEQERLYKTVDRIISNLQIVSPRQNVSRTAPMVISIVYSASTPQMAAAVANMALDELIVFNQTVQNAATKANSDFLEQRLTEANNKLDEAEKNLANFERSNRKLATPDVKRELDRLKRLADQQQTIYITLNKQLELAKIQEQENKTFVDVLQRAIPPRKRTSPSFRKSVSIAGFLGLILFCGLALGSDFLERFNPKDEKSREFLETIQGIKGDAAKFGRLFGIRKKKRGNS